MRRSAIGKTKKIVDEVCTPVDRDDEQRGLDVDAQREHDCGKRGRDRADIRNERKETGEQSEG